MAGSNGSLSSAQAAVTIAVDTNPPAGSVFAYVSGTFVGTITFEASTDANSAVGSANWFTVAAVPFSSTAFLPYGLATSTTTTTGQWAIPNFGYAQVRARVSAYTSGVAYVALDASGEGLLLPVHLGDSYQVGGSASAPSAGTVVATMTPGVAGTFDVTVNTAISQGTPAAADVLNMQLRVTSTVISKLAIAGASGAGGPFGPFRVTILASDTINVNAVGSATASVNYAATICARRVA